MSPKNRPHPAASHGPAPRDACRESLRDSRVFIARFSAVFCDELSTGGRGISPHTGWNTHHFFLVPRVVCASCAAPLTPHTMPTCIGNRPLCVSCPRQALVLWCWAAPSFPPHFSCSLCVCGPRRGDDGLKCPRKKYTEKSREVVLFFVALSRSRLQHFLCVWCANLNLPLVCRAYSLFHTVLHGYL